MGDGLRADQDLRQVRASTLICTGKKRPERRLTNHDYHADRRTYETNDGAGSAADEDAEDHGTSSGLELSMRR